MSVNLVPQDELTLDLLAEVLAKMYRHSMDNGSNVPREGVESESTLCPDHRLRHQEHLASRGDLILTKMS
jgi:hypothetical protein